MVDATGKFLIPGLWDMHVHMDAEESLPLYIANGVTGVRVMFGAARHHQWRKAIEEGTLLGPRMVIASPIVDGPRPFWSGSISVANEAQARQAVTTAKQGGADFIKVYSYLPRDLYFDIADESKKQGIPFEGHVPNSVSAEEASRAGQKTFEHLYSILPACSTHSEELLRAQQADLADIIASTRPNFFAMTHVRPLRQMILDSYSPEKATALFALLKNNGTWQCPTLTVLHALAYGDDPVLINDPRLKYEGQGVQLGWRVLLGMWPPKARAYLKQEFQKDLEIVGAMRRSGVPILAGTDESNPYCLPGFGLHDELGFLVQAGLSPLEALQAATLNPARLLGKEKDFGTVETGKVGDLILLDANPLDDIGNANRISAVIYGGRLYSRSALDEMLTNAEKLASQSSVAASAMIWLVERPIVMHALSWVLINQYTVFQVYVPIGFALLLLAYVYVALALMALARKTSTAHAWWAWIPILNIVLMLRIARRPVWWIVLLLIPVVNIVIAALIWMGIAQNRQKSGWWGVVAIVPVVNLVVPGYLAWSV